MANILADHEIKKLLGSVLIGAEEQYINPNGIKLRLGKHVKFLSTEEEKELSNGLFLKVNPGESVAITSLEKIDFTADTIQKIYPESMLMGLINPTTTMMREGISQVSTKIDSGFRGILNWGLRNNSIKEITIQYGEPIFKLTIFLLKENELPNSQYGERETDIYQDSDGIKLSERRIPADIPKSKIISSSFDKLDPKKQLREAGHPFNHISTEITALHGKFEKVSNEFMDLKKEFDSRTVELSNKIEVETKNLSEKLNELRKDIIDRVEEKIETIFTKKFGRIFGNIIGAIIIIYGGLMFLESKNISGNKFGFIVLVVGILAFIITYSITRKSKR